MRELLNKLCSVSGVSSREEGVRALIQTEAAPYADEVRTDALGNLIVRKKGTKTGTLHVVLDAHMDECGVMVSGYTEEGFLRFQPVGPLDRRTIIGKQIFVGERQLPGVIGMKPIHLSSREERGAFPKQKELYIDIGAKNKEDARSKVELGDVGHFSEGCGRFGTSLWKGKALSSRIPCAVLMALLREVLPVDCTFVFSAQELVGTRGAYGAAFREKPNVVLCLDGVPAEDLWYTPERQRTCQPGGGVVLPVSDRFTMYHRPLFESLRSLAEQNGIAWQLLAKGTETSDARAYQCSREGVLTAGLGVPVRYLNAPTELADLGDAEAMLNLTRLFLNAQAVEEQR